MRSRLFSPALLFGAMLLALILGDGTIWP